jgi:hypothetical protein
MSAFLVIGYILLAFAMLRFTDDARVGCTTLAVLCLVMALVLFLAGWKFLGSADLALALFLAVGTTLARGRLPRSKK